MAASPVKPTCLFTETASGQPSCIALVENSSLFIIGTYHLDEGVSNEGEQSTAQPQSRSGSLEIYQLEDNGQIAIRQVHVLDTVQERPSGAILHMAFCQRPGYKNLLAVSTSTGMIILFRLLTSPTIDSYLERLKVITPFEETVIITSIAWSEALDNGINDKRNELAICTADGRIAVLLIRLPGFDEKEAGQQTSEILWLRHVHEESAWTVQWNSLELVNEKRIRMIYSGGDDATVHQIALPSFYEELVPDIHGDKEDKAMHSIDVLQSRSSPTDEHKYDSKTHQAGVTAIFPASDKSVLTGSYDGFIRYLRPSLTSRWVTMAELDLGGGVWQISLICKYTEDSELVVQKFLFLISCMHAGAKIVELSSTGNTGSQDWKFTVLSSFEEHDSMCYASAGLKLQEDSQHFRIISTSFYDRKICIWDFDWELRKQE